MKCRHCGGELVVENHAFYAHEANGSPWCSLEGPASELAAPEPLPDPELEAWLVAEAAADAIDAMYELARPTIFAHRWASARR